MEWNYHAERWLAREPQRLWRTHSDVVNAQLLMDWLPSRRVRTILKTDLFDEAVTAGLHPILADRAERVIGLDVSTQILATAKQRYPGLDCITADVRSMPIASGSVDAVVSLSTLDHFENLGDLEDALGELSRVLVRGGTLILTLDNLANPIVALRNLLPFSMTHAAGLVPYPVGKTQTPARLVRLMEEAGFDARDCTAIMHAPRVLAIPALSVMDRVMPRTVSNAMTSSLRRFEVLRNSPTRFLTGHFTAVLATKA
jgi:ubiquinone/menaquinone biosynthesis C-methylase UbiE